jgi:hypothetical protein
LQELQIPAPLPLAVFARQPAVNLPANHLSIAQTV